MEGLDVKADAYHVNNTTMKRLGMKGGLLRGGAEVFVVSKDDFQAYGTRAGLGGLTLGVYGPNGCHKFSAIMDARLHYLESGERQTVVPDDVNAETLAHEILHDIFLNMFFGDAHSERVFFTKLLFLVSFRWNIYFYSGKPCSISSCWLFKLY